MSLHQLRIDYTRAALDEATADPDPIRQFERWFGEALASGLREPNAMSLATADAQGRPSARTVLLREWDSRGFVFFTNYESRKGRELAENPQACLLFHWAELERQVRIEGRVTQISPAESDAYFRGRPLESRIGAWASPQSRVIADRAELEQRVEAVRERFADGEPPRPPHWGGYRLVPDAIEFWQGRASRLHDRLLYRRDDGGWTRQRLAP